MSAKKPIETSPLVAAAEAFADFLERYAALADALQKGTLDTRRGIRRASEALTEIASCEDGLQVQARALITALGAARDQQQAHAERVQARAIEVQRRSDQYDATMGRFEDIGRAAAELNTMAQALAGRRRISEQALRQDELPSLLCELDELQERMTAVATTGGGLVKDARAANFEEPARDTESLCQQLLAARNKIGLLKEALGRAVPTSLIS